MFAELSNGTEYEIFQLDEGDDGLGFAWAALAGGASSILGGAMGMWQQYKAQKNTRESIRKTYKAQTKLITQEADVASKLSKQQFEQQMSLMQQARAVVKKVPTWVYWTAGGVVGLSVIYLVVKRRRRK